jgi:hypothetical protein
MARSNQTPSQTTVAPKKPGQRRKIGSAHADPAIANRTPRQAHNQHNVTNSDVDSDALRAPQTVHIIDASCRHAIDQLECALAAASGDGAKGILLAVVEANQPHLFLNGVFESAQWQISNATAIQQVHEKLFHKFESLQKLSFDAASRGPGFEDPSNSTARTNNVQTARRESGGRSITTHAPSEQSLKTLAPPYTKSPQPLSKRPRKRSLKRSLSTTSSTSYFSEESDSDRSEPHGETIIDKSFRTNDRAAVQEYLKFRLFEFPGVLLKDVVNVWVKKVPEWKGFQKAGELQSAPKSWPEGVCFIGVHRLKKRDVVKLGAHVLTRFYYDEDAYEGWSEKLKKRIQPYLEDDEHAKFSSSSNPQTREENRYLVQELILPEIWNNLKDVEDYEDMRRERERNGDPPQEGTTITYHPFRIRKKRPKGERSMPVRQKKPAKQQKPRRQRGTGQKNGGVKPESFAAKFSEMMPPVDENVNEDEYSPTEPESPDMEMHDEPRAASPSPSVASDGGFQVEQGNAHAQETQNSDLNVDAYPSFQQRSFKASFSCGLDMQDIPPMDTNVNRWTDTTQFAFERQYQQPEMENGHLQSFYADVRNYAQQCPSTSVSFSSVAVPEHAADSQSFPQLETTPMGGFHSFNVPDQSQVPEHVPEQCIEPLNAFPTFSNIISTGFAQYPVSNGFSEPGYYGTASGPTVLPSAIPAQIPFANQFSGSILASTLREYEPQPSRYGGNMTMDQTPLH